MRFRIAPVYSSKLALLTERTHRELMGVEADLRGYSRSPFVAYSLRALRTQGRALQHFSSKQPEIAPHVCSLNSHIADLCKSLTDEHGRTVGGIALKTLHAETLLALLGAHEALGRLNSIHVTVRG